MPLHLIKLCVGVDEIDELAAWQRKRLAQQKAAGVKKPSLRHLTRHKPRRAEELLDGGSLYWVIKGLVRVRQRITGLKTGTNDKGEARCAIHLDRKLVRVVPRQMRAFQGWRYLDAADAPRDLSTLGAAAADIPPKMAEELRALGLL